MRALVLVAALAGVASAKAPPDPPFPMTRFATLRDAMRGVRLVETRYVPGLGMLWHVEAPFGALVVLVDGQGAWRAGANLETALLESRLEVVYLGGQPAFRLRVSSRTTKSGVVCTREHFCRELIE